MCSTASNAGGARQAARGNGSTTTTPTYSAIGLVANTSETGAVAAFNASGSTAGLVVAYNPVSVSRFSNDASPLTAFDFSSSTNEPPNNIIVSGSTAYLLTRPGGAGLFRRSITSVNATPVDGTPVTIAASGSGALTVGQSLVGTDSLVGGMSTLSSFYRLNSSTIVGSGNLGVDADNGLAAFDGTLAFAGRGNDLVAFSPTNLTAIPTVLATVTANVRTSPVLGNARTGGNPLGYAVTSTGALYVFPLTATAGSATDFGAIFSSGTVYGHPTLDCNRRPGAATATTGVLYVTNNQGRVAAIIVDSPKLLTTSGAWPKYQRTAGNAGNPDDTRFGLNPSCP